MESAPACARGYSFGGGEAEAPTPSLEKKHPVFRGRGPPDEVNRRLAAELLRPPLVRGLLRGVCGGGVAGTTFSQAVQNGDLLCHLTPQCPSPDPIYANNYTLVALGSAYDFISAP